MGNCKDCRIWQQRYIHDQIGKTGFCSKWFVRELEGCSRLITRNQALAECLATPEDFGCSLFEEEPNGPFRAMVGLLFTRVSWHLTFEDDILGLPLDQGQAESLARGLNRIWRQSNNPQKERP